MGCAGVGRKQDLKLELFEKREIWVKPVRMRNVDLDAVAEKVSKILNLRKREVMVVDVREDVLTLDIMRDAVEAQDIIGKREDLLRALAEIPGVSLTPDTTIHSDGILGLIDIDDQKVAKKVLKRMERMGRQISDRIQKRAVIFSSGPEIQNGLIQDTNTPYIRKRLTEEGFTVTTGIVLDDNTESIASVLAAATNEGFGIIVTTGGVGAEHKDRMIEALQALDPNAATPYIMRYEKGTGRHEKDGVKIGVAHLSPSFIVALPGPHEEAKIGIEAIIEGLKRGMEKEALAEYLAERLIEFRRKIHQK
jgi:molybdenum cofactor synthesis domain-containing protein